MQERCAMPARIRSARSSGTDAPSVAIVEKTRAEAISAAFTLNYAEYQYHFVEFLAEHLTDVGRAFDGDFQAVVILAYVGQTALRHVREQQGPEPHADLPTISASRLADVTGIPRATVRRKLTALEQRGWLVRVGSAWRLRTLDGTTQARRDLEALDARGIKRVARFVARVEPLLPK
jgi:predicted transcriptional regulator